MLALRISFMNNLTHLINAGAMDSRYVGVANTQTITGAKNLTQPLSFKSKGTLDYNESTNTFDFNFL